MIDFFSEGHEDLFPEVLRNVNLGLTGCYAALAVCEQAAIRLPIFATLLVKMPKKIQQVSVI
jgi:hypothetical protein